MLMNMTRGWAAAEEAVSRAEAENEAPPARSRRSKDGVVDPRVKPASERVDWEAVENDYVWGETLSQREDGSYVRKYPTFKQLGKKFGCAPSVVHYYAKRGNWADRRLRAIKQTKEEFDAELAKSRARSTADVVETMDRWIKGFDDKLRQGKVDTTSVVDLDKIVRLRAFVLGQGDSRTEVKVTVTLDMLQQRHQASRARLLDAVGPVAGELPNEEAAVLAGRVLDSGEPTHEGEEEPQAGAA
jgi:hypothetical protein